MQLFVSFPPENIAKYEIVNVDIIDICYSIFPHSKFNVKKKKKKKKKTKNYKIRNKKSNKSK